MKTLLLLFVMSAFSPCWGQSSDNLVLQGRAFLVAKDMPNANSRFAAAVAISPNHQTANTLYAATRLLSMPYGTPAQDMMDRLGVSLTNRNIYNWTAKLPKNKQGKVIPPNGFNGMEFPAFMRSYVLPEIRGALDNLARITDVSFLLNLSSNETKVSEVTLDYGDIQMFRAFLHGFEFILNTVDSHNFDAQLTALYLMNEQGSLDLQNLLTTYTQALTFANAADLPVARVAFQNFVDRYVIASDFIRKRPQKIVRLFNYDATMDSSESQFRQTVTELRASLDGPVALTYATNGTQRVQANLGRLLDGSTPIRSLMPAFRENAVLLGSLQDPAFHGVVSGITPSEFYTFLEARMGVRLLPNFNLRAFPTVSLFVVDGRRYSIQASSDLLQWVDLTTTIGAGGIISFVDPELTRLDRRFYRAVDMSDFLFFEGTVVDAGNGKPIQGAVVGSFFDSQLTALTDSAGHFALQTRQSSKIRGSYVLNAKLNGYTTAQISGLINDGKMVIGGVAIKAAPSVPRQLGLRTQPVGSAPGGALSSQPVVEVRDGEGNPVGLGGSVSVTVTIGSGSGGSLGGTTTVTAVDGVATFANLTLSGTVGVNYVLRFSATGLTSVDSAPVSVMAPWGSSFVTVEDAGNAADATTGYGAVGYTFQIQKFEFTNGEYVEFLNAVGGTNPNGIYSSFMGSDARGGITQSGASPNFTYSVKANMGDKPVNYVSWFEAARVANWLHNGRSTNPSLLETGAYTLNNAMSGVGFTKNAGAKYWIPSENEWYKAAYYKGGGLSAGYWLYPTKSNTEPTYVTATSTGVGSAGLGSTANSINGNLDADWNGQNGNVTTVGSNGGPTAYGTYDMGGNVWEWDDGSVAGSNRVFRGAGWDGGSNGARSDGRGSYHADYRLPILGFRLARSSVP